MAGVEKVSEQEIIQTAEAMLIEANGELRRVSARQVQERIGGSNKRVNEIVGAWKRQKAEDATKPSSVKLPEPAVPDIVTRALDEATGKVRDLGPLVARLIEDASRAERQRCDREIATERERASSAIDETQKDADAARQESHGYSEDLDRLEEEKAELLGRLKTLHIELSAERSKTEVLNSDMDLMQKERAQSDLRAEQASAEAEKQRELREVCDRNASRMEAQLLAMSDTHRNELSDMRDRHRQEVESFRADYKEAESRARDSAVKLSEANATIHRLHEQLARIPEDRLTNKNSPPD